MSKTTFTEKNAETVLIRNLEHFTGTFFDNLFGDFWPIQFKYTRKTDFCHPKVKFLKGYDVTQM